MGTPDLRCSVPTTFDEQRTGHLSFKTIGLIAALCSEHPIRRASPSKRKVSGSVAVKRLEGGTSKPRMRTAAHPLAAWDTGIALRCIPPHVPALSPAKYKRSYAKSPAMFNLAARSGSSSRRYVQNAVQPLTLRTSLTPQKERGATMKSYRVWSAKQRNI